jgi:hypothetical protein
MNKTERLGLTVTKREKDLVVELVGLAGGLSKAALMRKLIRDEAQSQKLIDLQIPAFMHHELPGFSQEVPKRNNYQKFSSAQHESTLDKGNQWILLWPELNETEPVAGDLGRDEAAGSDTEKSAGAEPNSLIQSAQQEIPWDQKLVQANKES